MKIKEAYNRFFYGTDYRNDSFLTFFRVNIALFLLILFISIIPDFELLFGKYSIVPADVQRPGLSKYILSLPRIVTFFEMHGITESVTLQWFQGLYITMAVFLMLGLFTRWAAFMLLIMHVAFTVSSVIYKYGADYFAIMSLFYLVILPVSKLSFDRLILSKSDSAKNLLPYLRIFQLHICIIYFFCGINKVFGLTWWNGEAIWEATNLYYLDHPLNISHVWPGVYRTTLMIFGWFTVIVELFYPLFIWIRGTQKIWLALTILLHLGIAFGMGLYLFSVIMIIWNLTAFYFIDNKKQNPEIRYPETQQLNA